MNWFTVVAVVLLLGSACSNPDDMEGLVPPNSMETIEMESEPYPE